MKKLLEINRVHVEIKSTNKVSVYPLKGVDLQVGLEETVGLVGESGCGKSMILRTILRMLPHGGYQTKGNISSKFFLTFSFNTTYIKRDGEK